MNMLYLLLRALEFAAEFWGPSLSRPLRRDRGRRPLCLGGSGTG